MFNGEFEEVVTTQVTVKQNKTTTIFTEPTHTCVKLYNQSLRNIIDFRYVKNSVSYSILDFDEIIVPGDSLYYRLEPSQPEDIITYHFEYLIEGDNDFTVTEAVSTMYLDVVYPITVVDND